MGDDFIWLHVLQLSQVTLHNSLTCLIWLLELQIQKVRWNIVKGKQSQDLFILFRFVTFSFDSQLVLSSRRSL